MPTGFSWTELQVDPARVHVIKEASLSEKGEFVLYWCQINHRAEHNAALDAAIALGNHLGLPVVCYQALRPDYPYASDRIHQFILQGHDDVAAGMDARGVTYWRELLTKKSHRLRELGKRAAAIVSDFFPTYIVPGHLRGAARQIDVPLFAMDASCVIPMKRIPDAQIGARTLRPKVHKLWPEYRGLSKALKPKHTRAPKADFDTDTKTPPLKSLPIDHLVAPIEDRPGGRAAGLKRLQQFIQKDLERYGEGRDDPGDDHSSGLSPYFHFGQVSSLEAVHAAIDALGEKHPSVASFFEQVVVRRELGFNYCFHTSLPEQLSFSSLPNWAQKTLNEHRKDKREIYTDEILETGETADEVWNAAQHELLERGTIHNYLRMLWGKKILEWSRTPEDGLRRIAWLNDKYALDGRDPVSVGNFMWILGLHDRPFQERSVIGKTRPMSSARTVEKLDLKPYLVRYE
ncbi:MAG: deoxyribodipyrimidine photo-lyase [Myxococcaceae bacterium]